MKHFYKQKPILFIIFLMVGFLNWGCSPQAKPTTTRMENEIENVNLVTKSSGKADSILKCKKPSCCIGAPSRLKAVIAKK